MSRWLFSRKHFPWTKRCPGLLFLSLPGVTLSLSLHLFSLQYHVSFSSSSAAFTAPFLPTQNPNFTFLRPDICSFVQPWIKMHADYQKHWKMSSFFVIEQMRNEKSDVPLTLNWSRGLEFFANVVFSCSFSTFRATEGRRMDKRAPKCDAGFYFKMLFSWWRRGFTRQKNTANTCGASFSEDETMMLSKTLFCSFYVPLIVKNHTGRYELT